MPYSACPSEALHHCDREPGPKKAQHSITIPHGTRKSPNRNSGVRRRLRRSMVGWFLPFLGDGSKPPCKSSPAVRRRPLQLGHPSRSELSHFLEMRPSPRQNSVPNVSLRAIRNELASSRQVKHGGRTVPDDLREPCRLSWHQVWLGGSPFSFYRIVAAIARADLGSDHCLCDHARAVRRRSCGEGRDARDRHSDRGHHRIFADRQTRATARSLSLAGRRCGRFRHGHVWLHEVSLCVPALRFDHDGRREQRDERSQLLLEAGARASRGSQRRRDFRGACVEPHLATVCPEGVPGEDASRLG